MVGTVITDYELGGKKTRWERNPEEIIVVQREGPIKSREYICSP